MIAQRFGKKPIRLAAALIALAAFGTSISASATPLPSTGHQGDLSQWEQRLLGQPHEKDPLDKRIQRLELLLFGTTQEGSLGERLDGIRAALSSRQAVRPSKATVSGSLNQLEQKILKKTFVADPVENRLSRLETKLFGKASPSMSAADRIDRLKRTIGLGEPPPIAQFPSGGMFERMPMGQGFSGKMMIPFGDQGANPDELNRQMSDMFRQLNQQLRQMHRMPNGGGELIPPFSEPDLKQFRAAPNQSKQDELPPYLDPNSI